MEIYKEEALDDRIARIKRQNAELLKRHMEVEADKKRAAQQKALVVPHVNDDVNEMMPAERLATLESRNKKPVSSNGSHEFKSGNNSGRWEQVHDFENENKNQFRIRRPNTTIKNNLLHLLESSGESDIFDNVESLANLTFEIKNIKVEEEEKAMPYTAEAPFIKDNSPPLDFHPDMDLSMPPPPFTRKPIYGSGRLSKSRLNEESPNSNISRPSRPKSENFETIPKDVSCTPSYPSLNQLAQAIDSGDNFQIDKFETLHNLKSQSSDSDSKIFENFPEIGDFMPEKPKNAIERHNYTDFIPEKTIEKAPRKSAIQKRMEAVRQETCKRFSRAHHFAQDTSPGTVDFKFVKNTD